MTVASFFVNLRYPVNPNWSDDHSSDVVERTSKDDYAACGACYGGPRVRPLQRRTSRGHEGVGNLWFCPCLWYTKQMNPNPKPSPNPNWNGKARSRGCAREVRRDETLTLTLTPTLRWITQLGHRSIYTPSQTHIRIRIRIRILTGPPSGLRCISAPF